MGKLWKFCGQCYSCFSRCDVVMLASQHTTAQRQHSWIPRLHDHIAVVDVLTLAIASLQGLRRPCYQTHASQKDLLYAYVVQDVTGPTNCRQLGSSLCSIASARQGSSLRCRLQPGKAKEIGGLSKHVCFSFRYIVARACSVHVNDAS